MPLAVCYQRGPLLPPSRFLEGDVDPATNAWVQRQKLPTLPGNRQDLDQVGQEDINDAFEIRPTPSGAAASTLPLFAPSTFGDLVYPAAQVDQAFAVENPKKVDAFSTDCVSCHSASSRLFRVTIAPEGRPIGQGPENVSRMQIPAGVSGYIRPENFQSDVWSTRNFGFFSRQASISGRTANESSEIVEWLNKEIQQRGVPQDQRRAGTGLRCASDAEVALCLLRALPSDEAACFDKCTR